ncbi:unnamed protein product [Ceutorhynchus assimilis]|uniref:Uncharacterized protein n=1 Tax=Ceutorhynchus assimilis TaxID=467358 RepID=A0A9N9N0J2_9CUCU|nr:unnamed protein product [Ceutorhynchus assimilis]
MTLTDQRGIAGGRNKLSETIVQKVVDQINKIPRYKSHYRREKTDSDFLPPGTTIQKMYEVYCSEENNPISIASYKIIFYSKFNLRMKPLKKDTCNTCDRLKIQMDNEKDFEKREELKVKHSEHLELAEGSQKLRRQHFKTAKENEDYECLTFDLEKTLPLPRIPTNIVFYKRQLWVYNAGVHSGKKELGYCYVWIEGEAGRGSQEVGSCLLKHIQHQVSPTVKHLILRNDVVVKIEISI